MNKLNYDTDVFVELPEVCYPADSYILADPKAPGGQRVEWSIGTLTFKSPADKPKPVTQGEANG